MLAPRVQVDVTSVKKGSVIVETVVAFKLGVSDAEADAATTAILNNPNAVFDQTFLNSYGGSILASSALIKVRSDTYICTIVLAHAQVLQNYLL